MTAREREGVRRALEKMAYTQKHLAGDESATDFHKAFHDLVDAMRSLRAMVNQ